MIFLFGFLSTTQGVVKLRRHLLWKIIWYDESFGTNDFFFKTIWNKRKKHMKFNFFPRSVSSLTSAVLIVRLIDRRNSTRLKRTNRFEIIPINFVFSNFPQLLKEPKTGGLVVLFLFPTEISKNNFIRPMTAKNRLNL